MIKYPKARYKSLSREEENELFQEYQSTKSLKTRDKIFNNYAALAHFYANKMSHKRFQSEDILQEAMVGLAKAIERFDPTKNCRFMYYAGNWIKAYIFNYVYDNQSIVSIPNNAHFRKAFWNFHRSFGLSDEDFGKKYDIPAEDVQNLKVITTSPEFSLDYKWKKGLENTIEYDLYDLVSFKKSLDNVSRTNFEQGFIDAEENSVKLKAINESLNKLKPKEKEIVLKRYSEEKTMQVIGNEMGCSRQWIERVLNKSIETLKRDLL